MPRVAHQEDLHAGKPRLVLRVETWRFVPPDHTDETRRFWVVEGALLANLKAAYGANLDDLRHRFATALDPAPPDHILIIEETF